MGDVFDRAVKMLDTIVQVVSDVPDPVLMETGQFALTLIVLRTKRGQGADGNPFVPYSLDYQRARLRKSLTASPPDLTRTGQMLGSMLVRITGPNVVTLAFGTAFDAMKAEVQSKTRTFLRIDTQAERQALAEVAIAGIERELKQSMDDFAGSA